MCVTFFLDFFKNYFLGRLWSSDYHDEKYQGVRQPVTSNPALRLYKYSVYDGKVCLFELIMLDCDYCDCDKNMMKLKRNYQVLDYTQFSLSLERSAKEPHRAVWEAQVPFSKSHLYMAIISRTESCKWFQFFKSLSLSAFPTQFCTE